MGFSAGLDSSTLGALIAGLLLATWLASVLIWRYGRIEQRWTLRTTNERRMP
jgi:high-affinity nickel-transport protein